MKNSRIFLLVFSCFITTALFAQKPAVETGIEVLRARGFDVLQGKRVGLVTNATGVDAQLRSTIDILHTAPGVRLVALFGPEHGVRGDFAAGDKVETYTDARTGLPAYSLYGRTWKPSPEMLKGIDVLVYDIQDIGCRSYTYISTMGLVMEAAAEAKLPVVVLDRPNPLGGVRVEGNLVEQGFESFVSPFAIPYVYGLSCGELARLLNGEGLLSGGMRCSLTVIPMRGWKRSMDFRGTGLPWVPTSPHVPADDSPAYYVSTGVLGELGVISEGVGYTSPFRVLGATWIDPDALAEKMNALKIPGVLFRPVSFKPFYGRDQGAQVKGVEIHLRDISRVNLMSIQFLFLQAHHELYAEKNPFTLARDGRLAMFDKVAGSDTVRKLFSKKMRYEDVRAFLEKDVEQFRARSRPYLLYK